MNVQDVLALADKKWGGLEGFLKADNKRRQAEATRQANKRAKYEASDEYKAEQALIAAAPAREQALKASLAEHGIQLERERSFRPFKDYLRKGIGDPAQLAIKAAHLQWLFSNTDVRERMTRVSACKFCTLDCTLDCIVIVTISSYVCDFMLCRASSYPA